MADEYVGGQVYSSGSGTSASCDLTIPAEVEPGDVLYAWVSWGAGIVAATPPGWSQLLQQTIQNNINANLYRRVAQPGDPGQTVAFVLEGGQSRAVVGILRAYRGVDTDTPEDDNAIDSALESPPAAPSVTSAGGVSVVFYSARFAADPGSWAAPAGYGRGQYTVRVPPPYAWATAVFDASIGAGSTGTVTSFVSALNWVAAHIALNPAPVAEDYDGVGVPYLVGVSYSAGAATGVEVAGVAGGNVSVPMAYAEGSASGAEAGITGGTTFDTTIVYGGGTTVAAEQGSGSGLSLELPVTYGSGETIATETNTAAGLPLTVPVTLNHGDALGEETATVAGGTIAVDTTCGIGHTVAALAASAAGIPLAVDIDYSAGVLKREARDIDITAGDITTGWHASTVTDDWAATQTTANPIAGGPVSAGWDTGSIDGSDIAAGDTSRSDLITTGELSPSGWTAGPIYVQE